jgi:hypothetical protein
LEERETLPVVEAAVKIDRFDIELEGVEQTEKLREDIAGGVAVGQTAHRQRVALFESSGSETSTGGGIGNGFADAASRDKPSSLLRRVLYRFVE